MATHVNYSVIFKSETFGEDKKHILEMMGQEDRLNIHGKDSTADITRKYFRNIPQELRTKQ